MTDMIFRCPETHQALKSATKQRITALNKKIAAGSLLNDSGKRVVQPLESGLERADKKVVYPIRNGLTCFLLTDRIPL